MRSNSEDFKIKKRDKMRVVYNSMKLRCRDEKHSSFKWYGNRGIKICLRWLKSFNNFYKDMEKTYRLGYCLDRIDNNGNYCKDNCRWTTHQKNARNKSNTRKLTYKGQTKALYDWANEVGLSTDIVAGRYKSGWTAKRIIETPAPNR